jgi:hypothetical protein
MVKHSRTPSSHLRVYWQNWYTPASAIICFMNTPSLSACEDPRIPQLPESFLPLRDRAKRESSIRVVSDTHCQESP